MRLYSFRTGHKTLVGLERRGALVPLPFEDMLGLVNLGPAAFDLMEQLSHESKESYSFEDVEILAPIPRPGKIFCSGLNYHGHLLENPKAKLLEDPRFFVKTSDAVIGTEQAIRIPEEPLQVDYEVELAVVIGKRMFRPKQSEVMDHIFGYTILHDVSARRIQFKDNNEDSGKNFDTFAPIGPCIVTADEIPDPQNLGLRLWLNGELMQDGTNLDWIFPLPRLLAWLAMGITLNPGDIVSTGTPAGTGFFRDPQVFLKCGDVCKLEIDRIGCLVNSVEPVVGGHSEWGIDRSQK